MRWTTAAAVVSSALVGALATGCGSSNSSSPASSGTAGSGGATGAATTGAAGDSAASSSIVAQARAAVQKAMAQPSLPSYPVVKAPKGKSVMVVSCGQNAEGCRRIASGAAEGAQALGWKVTTIDGKLTTAGFAAGMRQGIQQHVTAVVNASIPDTVVPSVVDAVKRARIIMACAVCGNKTNGSGSQVNSDPNYSLQGKLLADWVIADSDGHAKVAILPDVAYTSLVARTNGFKSEIERCGTCKIVANQSVPATGDVVTAYRDAMLGLLRRFGKGQLTYVMSTSDSEAVGAVQAIQTTGRTDVKDVGYDCNSINLKWIREGNQGEAACEATGLEWGGWAAINGVVRKLVTGASTVTDHRVGIRLITKQNAPPEGEPAITANYAAAFKRSWGF